MRLRLEYEALGLIIPDESIHWDEEDSFAYDNGTTIVGYNRNVETFWRNCPEDDNWPEDR